MLYHLNLYTKLLKCPSRTTTEKITGGCDISYKIQFNAISHKDHVYIAPLYRTIEHWTSELCQFITSIISSTSMAHWKQYGRGRTTATTQLSMTDKVTECSIRQPNISDSCQKQTGVKLLLCQMKDSSQDVVKMPLHPQAWQHDRNNLATL